jgi:hypothetical protein
MPRHTHPELAGSPLVVYADADRQLVDCSGSVPAFLQHDRTALLRKRIDEISYWSADVPSIFRDFVRAGAQDGDFVLRRNDGSPLPIHYRSFVFPDGCKGAAWEVIADWRAAYLDAFSEASAKPLNRRVDLALAAIYRRLYEPGARDLELLQERTEIFTALAKVDELKSSLQAPSTLHLPALEETRTALLRLADHPTDARALEQFFGRNQLQIHATIRHWFPEALAQQVLTSLLEHLAHKARYYDPGENPVIWLHQCLDLECRRVLRDVSSPKEKEI